MFGVGPQEVVIIVLLLLVVLGPGKAVGMAKDLGRFANEARNHMDLFKEELVSSQEDGSQIRGPSKRNTF
jgi:Sec-independent protein translocase protein TatA